LNAAFGAESAPAGHPSAGAVPGVPAAAAPLSSAGVAAQQIKLNALPIEIDESIARIGDETFWVELMQTYLVDIEQRLSQSEAALREGNFEVVHHEAHTIKGSSAEMAISGMRELALVIEKLAQSGDLDSAAPLMARMRGEFMRLKVYLASQRPEFN
jgi:HPt (histidine-containing phosphotransfer) domain-containing protein